VSRAALQLGEGAAPYLGTPALPALLAELRAVVAASDYADPAAAGPEAGGHGAGVAGAASSGAGGAGGGIEGGGSGGPGGGKRGMGIEPAMSARKSSQKKQRRSREKEVGRALAAADAAAAATATATAASNGAAAFGGSGGGGGGGVQVTGAAALGDEEAVCAGLRCLARLVVVCKGHLPMGGRLAVEEVLHRGLELLASVGKEGGSKGPSGWGGGSSGGGGGGGRGGGAGQGRGRSRLEHPRVALEFFGLAHACLVTPLVRERVSRCWLCCACLRHAPLAQKA